jgi:dimethylaniline monooxygenase (N-oxide forming)
MNKLAEAVGGQRVVVTGASSGIGRALALELGRFGAQLILISRREAELEHVAAAVAKLGGTASVYPADLAQPSTVNEVAAQILVEHGGVDVLINNAGRSIRRPVECSYERLHDFQRTMQINYFGALGLILAFLPGMRERGHGHVVNISSMATQNATPPFSAYNASKSALDAWTRTAAAEVVRDGVTMTTVYMPLVNTAMSAASGAYAGARLLTVDQAAHMVCQALVTRSARVAPTAGTAGEILAAVAPGIHRRAIELGYRRLPGFETGWRRRKASEPLAPSGAKSVCVIGAGSSGIAVAKALHQRGIPFDCYECGERIGGNWVFGNTNGMSAAYRGLHINSSKRRMQFSDFPMPADYPDYPHHTQVADYFDSYVDHFGFRDHISLNTTVEHVTRRSDGGFDVRLNSGHIRRYDAVAVANGHHWDPRWPEPEFPGHFDGVQMHAHDYVDNTNLAGKNVVVVGLGNSAMDIAVESSHVAANTYLAGRRGVHIVPKYVFGRPLDEFPNDPRIPLWLRQRLFGALIRLSSGRVERYGLPKPDHHILEAHPTISNRILDRLSHGAITPKPNIAQLAGDQVEFAGGTSCLADVIIYCTGYRITFPFFDEDFVSAPDNEIRLYKNVITPGLENLWFIGLLQPLGASMPLAEAQARWMTAYLTGDYAFPDRNTLERVIDDDRARMARRYVASKRHTIQVDFDQYLRTVDREMSAGRDRAHRGASRSNRNRCHTTRGAEPPMWNCHRRPSTMLKS